MLGLPKHLWDLSPVVWLLAQTILPPAPTRGVTWLPPLLLARSCFCTDFPTRVPGATWGAQQEAEAERELEGEEERPCLCPEPTGTGLDVGADQERQLEGCWTFSRGQGSPRSGEM